jgi:hypothetical protein
MAQIPKKSIRKLVTLPPDLAERVEKFRAVSGASSESDALKLLIEAGLKLRDRPADLFQRCETSTLSGQSIGEIIGLVTSDHPLVERTVVDTDSLDVYLRAPADARTERFHFSRARRIWAWEYQTGNYDEWAPVVPPKPKRISEGGDLDDDIPF